MPSQNLCEYWPSKFFSCVFISERFYLKVMITGAAGRTVIIGRTLSIGSADVLRVR